MAPSHTPAHDVALATPYDEGHRLGTAWFQHRITASRDTRARQRIESLRDHWERFTPAERAANCDMHFVADSLDPDLGSSPGGAKRFFDRIEGGVDPHDLADPDFFRGFIDALLHGNTRCYPERRDRSLDAEPLPQRVRAPEPAPEANPPSPPCPESLEDLCRQQVPVAQAAKMLQLPIEHVRTEFARLNQAWEHEHAEYEARKAHETLAKLQARRAPSAACVPAKLSVATPLNPADAIAAKFSAMSHRRLRQACAARGIEVDLNAPRDRMLGLLISHEQSLLAGTVS